MAKDYYSILGVSKDVDETTLKKAYQKAALKWHPDRQKGGDEKQAKQAEEKFKEAAEAYEVLSDPKKKRIYDQSGEEGLKASAGGGGFQDPSVIFQMFTQGMPGMSAGMGGRGMQGVFMGGDDSMESMFESMMGGGGGGMFGGPRMKRTAAPRQKKPRPKGEPVEQEVFATLEELFKGVTKKLRITRRTFNEQTLEQGQEVQMIEFEILPGFKEGTKKRFPGLGDSTPSHDAGELVLVLREKPHGVFTRDGENLRTTVRVSLVDALSGNARGSLTGIDGREIVWNSDGQVISPKSKKVVVEQGMPKRQGGKPVGRGDLIIDFDITFPHTRIPVEKLREAGIQ